MHKSGLVILDANCYKYFEDDSVRERVESNLRVADLEIWPSTLNLLEIAKTKNATVRKRLLKLMSMVAGGRPLIPWPHELLRRVGQAILDGEPRFRLDPTGFEWILEEPFEIDEEHLEAARQFMDGMEHSFDEVHGDGRAAVQQFLKERGLAGHWENAEVFLAEQWATVQQLDTLIDSIWNRLELPAPPPYEDILNDQAFRLLLDGFGIAVFERAVLAQQPKQVEHADLLQLVYLGGHYRRILVTDDSGFYRAASAILDRRYRNARAMTWKDYVDA